MMLLSFELVFRSSHRLDDSNFVSNRAVIVMAVASWLVGMVEQSLAHLMEGC
jgi:hypothetical protein